MDEIFTDIFFSTAPVVPPPMPPPLSQFHLKVAKAFAPDAICDIPFVIILNPLLDDAPSNAYNWTPVAYTAYQCSNDNLYTVLIDAQPENQTRGVFKAIPRDNFILELARQIDTFQIEDFSFESGVWSARCKLLVETDPISLAPSPPDSAVEFIEYLPVQFRYSFCFWEKAENESGWKIIEEAEVW